MLAMTAREGRVFASLTEAAVAPAGPLPSVGQTDAVAAFARYLRSLPAPNRVALRVALLLLDQGSWGLGYRAPLRRLAGAPRDAYLARLRATPLKPLVDALRGVAQLFYYGDADVMRLIGYDAAARVSRGRALRERDGRW